ncbi:Uncharacterized membrane protein YheB, UPF0754 family [Marinobacter sp. es.048]|uniref:DUF445 family protein n=1 Tax=Marinobacter sp. es.048 TaxID=1761795 RepID=UPI000B595086|nr:DUF445 family protein [Marinobacter sp. es.048]SNC65676.1 Uncharacterized membrane protein YheB, UPF0754 family [Marinobacter sp. es.048]
MDRDLTQWDQNFRRGLLGTALVFGLLDYWFSGHNIWFRAGFVITVAGMVGYFTNFLAIKMLFQPKHGQVLGWQGLVPKNKDRIARSLAESVQEQLLSPDIILAYIRERKLIESGAENLAEWVDEHLQDPDVRKRITGFLVNVMRDRGPEALNHSLDLAESALQDLARDPEHIELWWNRLRTSMDQFLQSQSNREWLADRVRHWFQQEIPTIAGWLNRALDDYLRHRRRVGSLGLGLKNILSFDQQAIEQVLESFVSDPQVSDDFMKMLDAVVDEIQREMESPETQQRIQQRLENWVGSLGTTVRERLLPALIERTDQYLSDESNWARIEESLVAAIQWLKRQGMKALHSERGQDWATRAIELAVKRLNVTNVVEQQVRRLDTDELEKMVLDNTGGNLTIIQILGGCLGLMLGTVQVHLAFALPLALLVLAAWVAWRLNERKT